VLFTFFVLFYRFHQKSLNILISTKVLEEGLDVPSCNFILRYDPILTYPSFIQSMGRARQKGAKFYALVEQKKNDKEQSKINKYKTFRSTLTQSLIKNIDIELTDEYYNDENLEESELNRLVPPFKPSAGPQMITAGSAIQIVYRYNLIEV
jgi:endoribonuclease Dicer